MRLNGEIQPEKEERKVADSFNLQTYSIGIRFPHSQSHDLVVRYALTFKKKKSFLQPKLLCLARNKGIFFVAIDLYRPLSDQGPFYAVLNKVQRLAAIYHLRSGCQGSKKKRFVTVVRTHIVFTEPIEVMQRPKSLGLGMEFSNSNEDPTSTKSQRTEVSNSRSEL